MTLIVSNLVIVSSDTLYFNIVSNFGKSFALQTIPIPTYTILRTGHTVYKYKN